ncbi:3-oxoadipate enol-lactonase [Nocardia amikacinitolerans]|uniref:3-oxoadipate enol-lactonase n=1 Tax=Nocardia amikacinitolerans TaxID=756689 RepID=UPI0020A374FE|nr:3-oxoadipate enol-lactonase [Nocardia amikacinitolerans]MCP2288399.1 3-carboxy-cis,cis-muconate cycloisomerase/3-oxoadipate enol-lactonase,TIGR02427 [Nocardia amikacinitolerans]
MSELFGPLRAAGQVAEETGDVGWLTALLGTEAALAGALADAGLIAAEHAEAIAAVCKPELYDVSEIGLTATGVGNPAAPVVRALTARVADPAAAGVVHLGATSQDIMDTAAMLIAARSIDALLVDLAACTEQLARLTEQHAATPAVGRSLLQQALPITFGLTTAGWLSALGAAADRIIQVRVEQLAVQLGGAVGTLASLGADGPATLSAFARRLNLAEPELPWHTDRSRITETAGALGTLAAAVAKIGRDLTLLSQTEIGEVSEHAPGHGGSSTMPHKRNPIAAVCAVAAAAQAPGLVATLLAAAPDLQRGAGSWHAEWQPFTELLRSTGSAVSWLRTSLSRLRIHPERMRRNLAATGGALLAERVSTALIPQLGRLTAHEVVGECVARADGSLTFADALRAHPRLAGLLDRGDIEALLEPSTYLGSTQFFVGRALAEHARRQRAGNTTLDSDLSRADAVNRGGHGRAEPVIGARPRTTGPVDLRSESYGDGSGEAVLLVNALGSDLSIWDDYVRPLADMGFRVIRCDTRGHGDSPVPLGPYSLADLGGDLESVLDRHAVESAHVVGISLGAMTGLWLARHRPLRVRRLVACCTSARPGNPQVWRARAAQARAEGMAAIATASVGRWFTPEFAAANPTFVARKRLLTADTPAEGYAACCEALAEIDLLDELPAITAPTLVLSTAQDPAFPPEDGMAIAERIPGARFRNIDNAAHLGTLEQPGLFLTAIADHLQESSRDQ